jgi:hypothetical protein
LMKEREKEKENENKHRIDKGVLADIQEQR